MAGELLRPDNAPANQLDYDDRHDTRATQSREGSELYVLLRKSKRADAWHGVLMRLIELAAAVTVFLAGLVALTKSLPRYDPAGAARFVAMGFALGSCGMAARSFKSAVRNRRQRAPHDGP
jgi:hypothetical protein